METLPLSSHYTSSVLTAVLKNGEAVEEELIYLW
jgi:hypothetical protein